MCADFRAWDVARRQDFVHKNRLCNNCLSKNHLVQECGNLRTCKTCRGKHHTMLHRLSSNTSAATVASTAIAENPPPAAVAISVMQPEVSTSLMATALITTSHREQKTTARAFLDTGAGISLVTSRTVQLPAPWTSRVSLATETW